MSPESAPAILPPEGLEPSIAAPRVVVLMSTYNGEQHVAEQLRSILEQLPESGRILVRDDGSTDGTVATLEALRDERVTVTAGPNLGFGRSFLTLLARVPPDAASLAEVPGFEQGDDVFDGVEQHCPRFFPPNGGEHRMLGQVAMRHYAGSDTRLYVDPGGRVTYRCLRSLNPTFIGDAEQIRRGEFAVDCHKLPGRYVYPWQRD